MRHVLVASLKMKADKERELRDTVCKQLVEGKRTIGMYDKNKQRNVKLFTAVHFAGKCWNTAVKVVLKSTFVKVEVASQKTTWVAVEVTHIST